MFALYLFSFLKNLHFFGALAVPFYLYRMGMNYTQMFALETVFSVLLFLFEVPTGVVADKTGRKISLFWGSLMFGGSFFVYALTKSFSILLAIQPIMACGMSLMSGSDRALLYETAKNAGKTELEVTTINARYDAFGTAGFLVAFPAGTLLASWGFVPYHTGLALAFAATSLCLVASSFVILLVKENPREQKKFNAIAHGIDGFKYIFRVPQLRSLALNYSVVSAFTFLMFWYYQALLITYEFPAAYLGFVAAGFNGLGLLSLLAAPTVQKKCGVRFVIFLTAFVPGLLYVSLFFVHGLPMALVAIFGVTVLRLFRSPLINTLMNVHIANSHRATVLSGVSMLERLIISFCYIPFGMLFDASSGLTFLVLGLLTIGASVFLRERNNSLAKTIL